MRPALSVVFLTTLIGAAQGLFLAVFLDADVGIRVGVLESVDPRFMVVGAASTVALTVLGLFASFFHLGRPERAWRAAARWRTSWLSREVILLPVFMALVAAYGLAHQLGSPLAFALGLMASLAGLALFFCTSMIYAGIRFLQEWASPYTVANFFLMGCASGTSFAVAFASMLAPQLERTMAGQAIVLALLALGVRLASLARNDRIVHRSSLQTAIGFPDPRIRQLTQGFTARSFNTHEFFHGAAPGTVAAARPAFLVLAFGAPAALIAAGSASHSAVLFAAAFVVQYAGLLLERWYFFVQARHPQNLYYQIKA